jgi:ankyrin repeat protein
MSNKQHLIHQYLAAFSLLISLFLQNCTSSPGTGHDIQKEKTATLSLYVAIEGGNIQEVNSALQTGVDIDINYTNELGFTPLYIAILEGHMEVAKKLIACGANVQDNFYIAIEKMDLAVAKQLVLLGANVNVKNKHNETLLHLATSNNELGRIKLLLLLGIDVNAKCENGWSALQLAALHGHMEIARLLIKQGSNVNSNDNNNFTPLYIAVLKGRLAVAKLLVEYGANINANLHTSIFKGHSEVSRRLALLSTQ